MLSCSTVEQDFATYELGERTLPWRDETSFADFLEHSFPETVHHSLDKHHAHTGEVDVLAALRASNLLKKAGLRFKPTNNIRDHLRITEDGFVEIFHHLAFIKECLLFSRDASGPGPCNMAAIIAE
jgi:hypothetical protein